MTKGILAYERSPRGAIVYAPPSQMQVGESVTFTLRISRKINDLDATTLKTIAGGSLEQATPIIEDSMKAYLSAYDKNDFDIEPVQAEAEQFIPPSGFAQWDWNVRALRRGTNRIELSIYGLLNTDTGKSAFRTSYDRTILVAVSPGYTIGHFISNNWQWLWTALLVPLAAFLMHRFVGRQAKRTRTEKDRARKHTKG